MLLFACLGLFAGFSALSMVEIFYFFILRIIFNCKTSTSQIASEQNLQSASNRNRKLKEYFENSSIHSFKHIAAENSRHQKIFWILFFVVSMDACEFMSRDIYKKFMKSSVTSFQSDQAFSTNKV
jgi:hypothetical protein